MSCKELRRAGVLARVKSGELKLGNAAVMMGLSYRQTKRLAKRYREEGAKGLKHGSAGRESNRKKPRKFRERVLRLVSGVAAGKDEAEPVVVDFLILVRRLADARLEVEREVFLCAVEARPPAHSVYSFEARG